MNDDRKRQILEQRLALLRGHIASVGELPGLTRQLAKAEDELSQLAEPREQRPQG